MSKLNGGISIANTLTNISFISLRKLDAKLLVNLMKRDACCIKRNEEGIGKRGMGF